MKTLFIILLTLSCASNQNSRIAELEEKLSKLTQQLDIPEEELTDDKPTQVKLTEFKQVIKEVDESLTHIIPITNNLGLNISLMVSSIGNYWIKFDESFNGRLDYISMLIPHHEKSPELIYFSQTNNYIFESNGPAVSTKLHIFLDIKISDQQSIIAELEIQ